MPYPKHLKFISFTLAVLCCSLILTGLTAWWQPTTVKAQNPNELANILKRLDNQSKAFVAAARLVRPAVVHITFEKKVTMPFGRRHRDPFHDFFGDDFFRRFFRDRFPRREFRQRGLGSGVIVSPQGHILTNNHVVKDASKITVRLADKQEFEAKILGTDPKSDIAVLKIDGHNLPAAKLGDSDNVEVGQWVIAIGNPFGLTQTVTTGIISAKGRANVGIVDYEDFIQTDAAINPGNSGGPLINLRGEVIGINTAILSRSGGYQGIGFAVPINMARNIMEQLISNGKVQRGWMGVYIQEITPALAQNLGLPNTEGILVSDVIPGSPAAAAGFQRDDVILYFGHAKIEKVNQLRNLVARTPVGSKVPVRIRRGEQELTLTLTIGNQSEAQQNTDADLDTKLGVKLGNLTPELAQRFGYGNEHGVVVLQVDPRGLAAQAGLRVGALILQLNRRPTPNLKAFQEAYAQTKGAKKILLLVKQNGFTHYIVLPR